MSAPTAHTRVLTILGDPVAHSLSPAMHNAAILAMGLDAVYVAQRCQAASLPRVMSAFEATGVSGNITVPYKIPAAKLLIRLTSVAKELGCVNTFWEEDGRLTGDNTDVGGMVDAVAQLGAAGPWLMAGTGGAARAVAGAAREIGARLFVRSRDDRRAEEFARWASGLGVDAEPDDGSTVTLAINATSLGLGDDDLRPFPEDRIIGCKAALDMVYRKGGTEWIRRCKNMGMRVQDGRVMLVAQGARSFERFFPKVKAPREIMSAAVERWLEG